MGDVRSGFIGQRTCCGFWFGFEQAHPNCSAKFTCGLAARGVGWDSCGICGQKLLTEQRPHVQWLQLLAGAHCCHLTSLVLATPEDPCACQLYAFARAICLDKRHRNTGSAKWRAPSVHWIPSLVSARIQSLRKATRITKERLPNWPAAWGVDLNNIDFVLSHPTLGCETVVMTTVPLIGKIWEDHLRSTCLESRVQMQKPHEAT